MQTKGGNIFSSKSLMRWMATFWILFCLFCTGLGLYNSEFYFEIEGEIELVNQSPNFLNPFGFDSLGRPYQSRLIPALSQSFLISTLATIISLLVSSILAVLISFSSKRISNLVLLFIDTFNSIPVVIFSALFLSVLSYRWGSFGWVTLGLLLGLTGWLPAVRVFAIGLKKELNSEYILASRSMGASNWHLIKIHLFSVLMNKSLNYIPILWPGFILSESFFSFIGVGLAPPETSLGILIKEGWGALDGGLHIVLFPSLIIFLTLLSIKIFTRKIDKIDLKGSHLSL